LIYNESPEARSAKVSGDVDELRAAFSNLLDNAVKYSDDEVQVSVSVSALDDKRLAVRVRQRHWHSERTTKTDLQTLLPCAWSLYGSSQGHWIRTFYCSFGGN
jgi:hypothetical protein